MGLKRKYFWLRLRKFFFTTLIGGFTVVLPIYIFIVLIQLIFGFVTTILEPVTKMIPFRNDTNTFIINLIAFFIIIGAFFIIGLIIRTQIGKNLFQYIEEEWFLRLPYYSIIKSTVEQFSDRKKMPFSKVVLVDVYNNQTRMIGFITSEHPSGNYTVFVPTGPNPTNGFIYLLKKEQVEFVKVKTEDAMRMIIGVGAGSSELFDY